MGVNSGVEGTGRSVDSSFAVTGAANTTTYTVSSVRWFAYGSVVEYNGVYAKITSVASNTKFMSNAALDVSNDLSVATIYIYYGN